MGRSKHYALKEILGLFISIAVILTALTLFIGDNQSTDHQPELIASDAGFFSLLPQSLQSIDANQFIFVFSILIFLVGTIMFILLLQDFNARLAYQKRQSGD